MELGGISSLSVSKVHHQSVHTSYCYTVVTHHHIRCILPTWMTLVLLLVRQVLFVGIVGPLLGGLEFIFLGLSLWKVLNEL